MQASYVIIGNGIAGVTAAEILRQEDPAASITVVADDPFPVYYRPALKDYLAGRVREDKLWARPSNFYQDERIRFLSDRVVGIQAGQHTVQLRSGQQVGYSRLLLANGARASSLTCPGINMAGVTTLRTVADYQAVVSRLGTARRIVVSGSGTLALETIETLRHRGYQVTHLVRHRTLWSEVLDLTASDLVLQQERRDGVDVRLEEEIAEIAGKNGRVSGVVTSKGTRISCDMVIIAIGIEPILDFIKSSGIPCGRGVKVDSGMRTGVPDIFAAGDVIETTDMVTGRRRVVGQWYPAIQQARAAAYSMLNLLDTERPFRTSTFYNATFLYGLDFASVGLTQIPKDGKDYQEIVADPQPRSYRKVVLKAGVAVGALSLGDRKNTLVIKRAIDHGVNLTPVVSHVFDEKFKLDGWLDQQGVPPPILSVSREGGVAVGGAGPARTGGRAEKADTDKKGSSALQAAMEALLVRMPAGPAQAGENKAAAAPGEETLLRKSRVTTIGRQQGVHLLIDHESVSRRHAEISYVDGQYVLRDLGSANGTRVNGTRLEGGNAYTLQPNDQVRFGKVTFVFQVRGGEVGAAGRRRDIAPGRTKLHEMATGFYDPDAAGQALLPSGQPVLHADGSLLLPGAEKAIPASTVASLKESPALIVVTSGQPTVFHLKRGRRITLGRDKGNDIVLAEIAASRKHAEVFPGPDGFYIRDLGSSNGVIVNRTKIDNPYLLAHGDRITIGSISLYFMNAGENVWGAFAQSLENVPQAFSLETPQASEEGTHCRNCGASNILTACFCANCGAPVGRNVWPVGALTG